MRLWVEILRYTISPPIYWVSLLVRLWVEIDFFGDSLQEAAVSLLVRLWVEMKILNQNFYLTAVSLLVRLWVEICRKRTLCDLRSSASSWGCELKLIIGDQTLTEKLSASSWGCELKYERQGILAQVKKSASSWGCELKCTWVRIPVWGQASCEVAYSTRYNKDSPTSIGGEMNCKQENERQWRAERNRYPPLTWGKSQSACCWHVRLCEITDCELKQILL